MDSPIVIPGAQAHRATSLRRRVSMDSNSPEFEFWMVRNPSFPQPNLLSADELFVDGVLLPLRLLSVTNPDPTAEPDPDDQKPAGPDQEPEPEPGPKIASSSRVPSLSPSKRWRDIFKKSDSGKDSGKESKKSDKDKDKEKKKERKSGSGSSGGSAELNINIWPFSRSRSAGNACTRPKAVFGAPGPTRKVNSAPCSRSNSAGDSKARKMPGSPVRPGVHLGRSSPVWKVRRNSGGKGIEALARNVDKMGLKKELPEIERNKVVAGTAAAGGGAAVKAKVLNLNVPMCMGYRNQLSCRNDENGALDIGSSGVGRSSRSLGGGGGRGGGGGGGVAMNGGSSGNLFNFRSLFTKKVY